MLTTRAIAQSSSAMAVENILEPVKNSVVKLFVFSLDNTLIDTRAADEYAFTHTGTYMARMLGVGIQTSEKILEHMKSALDESKGVPEDYFDLKDEKHVDKKWGRVERNLFRECDPYEVAAIHFTVNNFRIGLLKKSIEREIDGIEDFLAQTISERCYKYYMNARLYYISTMDHKLRDAKIVIDQLKKQGYKVAIVAHGPHCIQWPKIKVCGLRRHVDVIFISDDNKNIVYKHSISECPRGKCDTDAFTCHCSLAENRHVAYEHVTRAPNMLIAGMIPHYFGYFPFQCVMVGNSLVIDMLGAHHSSYGSYIHVHRVVLSRRHHEPEYPVDIPEYHICPLATIDRLTQLPFIFRSNQSV